jgi:hypothetical protein
MWLSIITLVESESGVAVPGCTTPFDSLHVLYVPTSLWNI